MEIKIKPTNNFEIEVESIRSYQAGVYKNGRGTFVKPAFKKYQNELLYQLPNIKIDVDAPIRLEIILLFAIPNTWKQTKKKNNAGKFATNNKDLDNMTKGIIDVIAGKCGFNDKNIADLHITKKWRKIGETNDKIAVKIENIEQ